MSAPRGPRGRGRGRGRGNFFNQHQQSDGDMAMVDTREDYRDDYSRGGRGRGRGRGGDFFRPNQRSDDQMAMTDAREDYRDDYQQGRGRGRVRGRGRGQPFNFHQDRRQQYDPQDPERDQAKSETFKLLEGFLGRRYDANTKLLDLSSIALDEEVRKSGMFDSEKTQKKFFPALMVVIDTMLPERGQKIAAIDSVTLANNNVPNLNVIYELVKTLNHIKNLDISGNKFADLGPLKPWKNRFKFVEHLITDPFPEPNWEEELTDWFPKLRILNNKQVRPDPATPGNALTMGTPNNPAELMAATAQPAELMAAPVNPEEQQKKEEMIAFVQQATNLTRDFAIQCLEAGSWDLQQASDLFASSRAALPPNAFN